MQRTITKHQNYTYQCAKLLKNNNKICDQRKDKTQVYYIISELVRRLLK